jgi:hypothetical protein
MEDLRETEGKKQAGMEKWRTKDSQMGERNSNEIGRTREANMEGEW